MSCGPVGSLGYIDEPASVKPPIQSETRCVELCCQFWVFNSYVTYYYYCMCVSICMYMCVCRVHTTAHVWRTLSEDGVQGSFVSFHPGSWQEACKVSMVFVFVFVFLTSRTITTAQSLWFYCEPREHLK